MFNQFKLKMHKFIKFIKMPDFQKVIILKNIFNKRQKSYVME